jgi:hypothetical protein
VVSDATALVALAAARAGFSVVLVERQAKAQILHSRAYPVVNGLRADDIVPRFSAALLPTMAAGRNAHSIARWR